MIKCFKCWLFFSYQLGPLMPNFKDLLFLAVDYGKQEVAKKLAHLGTDLTRRELVRDSVIHGFKRFI